MNAFIADHCSTDDTDDAVNSWQKNQFFTGDYVPHRIFRSACLSGGTGGNEALRCV